MAAAPEGPARAPQPAPSSGPGLLGPSPAATRNAGGAQSGSESATGSSTTPEFSELMNQGSQTAHAARASGARASSKRPSDPQPAPASAASPVFNATLSQVLGSCAAPASGAPAMSGSSAAEDPGTAAVASASDASNPTAAPAADAASAAGAAVLRALAMPACAAGDAGRAAPGTVSAETASEEPGGGSLASTANEALPALAQVAPVAARATATASSIASDQHASATGAGAATTTASVSAGPAPPDATSAGALLAHTFGAHPANDATPASAPINAPVGSSAWVDELGSRLILLSQRGIDSASLHMNPPELGPIEVRIDVRGSDASVWFGAAHADTRAALEQSLPRLRDLFAGQGMSLTDSGVSREPPRQQPSPAPASREAVIAGSASSVTSVTAARVGLIDLYA